MQSDQSECPDTRRLGASVGALAAANGEFSGGCGACGSISAGATAAAECRGPAAARGSAPGACAARSAGEAHRPRFPVVLFDLDGTLIDSNALIVASFQHVFRTLLGREVAASAIVSNFGEPLAATFARHARDAGHAAELVAAYRAYNLEHHDTLVREVAGVRGCLAQLRTAGVRVAGVTSKLGSVARRGLAVAGLESFVDVLVGPEDTAEHKPAAAPALRALELLGEAPGTHVLFVGDAHVDVLCGRAAGCWTAAVAWTALERATIEAAQPHTWVDTPAELAALVLGAMAVAPAPATAETAALAP